MVSSQFPLCREYCLVGVVFACLMALTGFLSYSHNGRRYFVKPTNASGRPPILFLHGLGIGPVIYFPFIWLLCRLGHPVFVIELRHLCLRLCFQAPSIDDVVRDVARILEVHRVKKCVVVGHSYGTFIASRLNALHPQRVAGLCLVDPVCCVMHNPKLVSTFVYRTLKWGCLRDCFSSFIVTFISHDPSIATSVCRQFRWTQLNLWPEEIPDKTILVLSEADMLVPVDDVKRVFDKTHARLVVHPAHSHGSLIVDHQWQKTIIKHIREMFR